MARDCWLNPKNKDNRLKWFDEKKFKCNNEVAAGGTDNASRKSDKLQLVNVHWGQHEEAFELDNEEAKEETKEMEEEIAAIQAEQKSTETKTEAML